MTEEWRSHCEWDGLIEVSSLGRVRSVTSVRCGVRQNGTVVRQTKKGRLNTPWLAKNGYLTVSIAINGVRHKRTIHRMVALAFVPGYFQDASVNHIDDNKQNNLPANLEWVTLAKNTSLQWKTGLINLRGERHPSSKLTNKQAEKIRTGLRKKRVVDIAEQFGISTSLVYMIRGGKKRSKYIGPT